MKYDIDSFYENMQMHMEKRSISQKEIYSSIGMAQANFSNAFNRKNGKHFTVEQMLQIAEFLNCSLDELFSKNNINSSEKYIKIPNMSEWTCRDLLALIFSLRKSQCKYGFKDITVGDGFMEENYTALYFSYSIEEKNAGFFGSSGSVKIVNSIIKEWSQILESTKRVDAESRELMLSTWEIKKLEQVQNIKLDDSVCKYDLDSNSKIYNKVDEEIPFN